MCRLCLPLPPLPPSSLQLAEGGGREGGKPFPEAYWLPVTSLFSRERAKITEYFWSKAECCTHLPGAQAGFPSSPPPIWLQAVYSSRKGEVPAVGSASLHSPTSHRAPGQKSLLNLGIQRPVLDQEEWMASRIHESEWGGGVDARKCVCTYAKTICSTACEKIRRQTTGPWERKKGFFPGPGYLQVDKVAD